MKKKKLKDICTMITDGSHYSPPSVENGFPIASVKDMHDYGIKLDDCRKISESEFNKLVSNGCKPQIGDVLIAKDGSYLKHVFVIEDEPQYVVLSSIGIFRPNLEIVNPYYLKYLFLNKSFKKYVSNGFVSGTALKRIVLKAFKEISLYLPSIEEQNVIVSKIKPIDEVIKNNKNLISLLEEYIQLLFHKWFVDFNFPNEEGKPYKDNGGEMFEVDGKMIPVGWTREKIGKWKKAELIKSGILEFEGEKRYITTSDVVGIDINLGADKVNYGDRTSRANMQPELNSVWFAKMQNSPKHIFITEENFVESYILSTGFAGLRCDEISFPYIATFVNSRQFEEMKNLRCNGSTQKAINDEGIKTIKVVIPNEEVLSSFSKITYPIYKKINLLQQENQLLEETRDLLIKKLIK